MRRALLLALKKMNEESGAVECSEKFKVDVSGGDGYRKLREEEKDALKETLNRFSEDATKISAQEIEFKKGEECIASSSSSSSSSRLICGILFKYDHFVFIVFESSNIFFELVLLQLCIAAYACSLIDLVKFLTGKLKKEMGGHLFRTFKTGSAYEKVQAGEAKDFDIMIFLNVRKWAWEVRSYSCSTIRL